MPVSLCPLSHWRHGSSAPPRALSLAEKRARYWELRASHKRVALGRGLRTARLASEAFYMSLFAESLEQVGAPGLARTSNDFELTARARPWPGLSSTEASRA